MVRTSRGTSEISIATLCAAPNFARERQSMSTQARGLCAGYRRMEGADAGCAVALVGVGAALTLRLASVLLRGKAGGGDKP